MDLAWVPMWAYWLLFAVAIWLCVAFAASLLAGAAFKRMNERDQQIWDDWTRGRRA